MELDCPRFNVKQFAQGLTLNNSETESAVNLISGRKGADQNDFWIPNRLIRRIDRERLRERVTERVRIPFGETYG